MKLLKVLAIALLAAPILVSCDSKDKNEPTPAPAPAPTPSPVPTDTVAATEYSGTTTIVGGGTTFVNSEMTYKCEFLPAEKPTHINLYMYEAKFAPGMPGINFVLENIPVKEEGNSFSYAVSDTIIPIRLVGNNKIPFPKAPVTNIVGKGTKGANGTLSTSSNIKFGNVTYTVTANDLNAVAAK